ncbi:unnamed protein product [Paramecium octaurelia]|uniref:VIT family protein n=1 Tax=Paramecium octaurelia TaxID=43137 RepID=A0A8S1TDV3_PAROT|nr:unnamed protein product [Paramecium octaurelia]
MNQAQIAFEKKDVDLSKKAHTNEEQQQLNEDHEEKHQRGGEHIKSAVYGGLDGMVTTFSVVAGVAGAGLSTGVVLGMGIANLIGDGISMALGDYISTRSEAEFTINERNREQWEVETNPEGEKKEMVEIYKSKGIDHDEAVIIADTLSKNKKVWVDVMMVEELGLMSIDEHPIKDAIVTFFSFGLFGLMPLLPFIVGSIAGMSDNLFETSIALTGFFLFILGVSKSFFSYQKWYWAGLETLIIGSAAASASYLIGLAFEGVNV